MDVRPQIAGIEATLKNRGISVARLCRRAELAQTTWVRWKSGTPAQLRSWNRVSAALAELLPDASVLAEPREAA